jgi:DNA polymerase-3 subunit delta'
MAWQNILGQERPTSILRHAIESDRLAHAYLFTGAVGVGTEAVAIELAKTVNCRSGKGTACGECDSCQKADRLQHPNIHLIFPLPVGKGEAAGDPPMQKLSAEEVSLVREEIRLKSQDRYRTISIPRANTIKVSSIREIRRLSSLSSFEGGKKCFLIFGAEEMADTAANALLKTLEEPVGDTLIILTTAQPSKLLPTILSRCQVLKFGMLDELVMARALEERLQLGTTEAQLAARLASNNYANAVAAAGKDLQNDRREMVDYLRTLLYKSREEESKFIETFAAGNNRPRVQERLLVLQTWIHDAMVLDAGGADVVNNDDTEALKKFVAFHTAANYPSMVEALEESIQALEKNAYISLILQVLGARLRRAALEGVPSLSRATLAITNNLEHEI